MLDQPSAKLLTVKECAEAGNAATLRTQIKLRRGIQPTLVGQLYPSILEGEIAELFKLLEEFER